MCNTPDSPSQTPRPRWGALYLIFVAVLCGLTLTAVVTSAATRVTAGSATTVAAVAGLAWWLSANRVALDMACWCECAASAVTVRVVNATTAHDGLGLRDPESLADHQAAREDEQQRDEVEADAEPAHGKQHALVKGKHQQSERDHAGGLVLLHREAA